MTKLSATSFSRSSTLLAHTNARAARRFGQRSALAALAAMGLGALVLGAAPQALPDRSAAAPLYDLERDEAIGGHTIERHTGKTDSDLAERLKRESQISAASTYPDVDTARRVVGAAIAQSRRRLEAWAKRSGTRPNLVLNYTQQDGRSIGRSLARGQRVARTCTRALVVIRWHERQKRWYVLTSYPEVSR